MGSFSQGMRNVLGAAGLSGAMIDALEATSLTDDSGALTLTTDTQADGTAPDITITGAAATSGEGADINITGGAGGTGATTGDVTITGGAGTGAAVAGGTVTLVGGVGFGTGNGGPVTIQAGNSGSGATGNGGTLSIQSGVPLSTDGNGGNVSVTVRPGVGTGTAGEFLVGATPDSSLVFINCEIIPTSITKACFVATRPMRVKAIILRVTATDAGEVVDVFKAPSATALGSGTQLNLTQGDLSTGANTNQTLGISATAAALEIATGDAIGLVFGSALDTATGVVTIALAYA